MNGLTVLVPTCRRPEYLSNCLQSIANQSRRELIGEVIVSENSSDPRSEKVVSSFAELLPIRFRRQEPDLPVYQHWLELIDCVNSSYVALIGDDDMWGRYHLEEAERAFAELPTAKSFFGQCVFTCSETCYPLASMGPSLLQAPFHADRSLHEFFLWDKRHTAMHCISGEPLNIWALVSETGALKTAMDIVFRDPRFSTPRLAISAGKMLIWQLSKLGNIAVSRNISLYYRRHHDSTSVSLQREHELETDQSDSEMSLEISRQAAELGINAFQDWQDSYNSAVNIYGLRDVIFPSTQSLKNFLNSEPEVVVVEPSPQEIVRRKLKRLVHLLVPPVVPLLASKIRSRLV
jgi:Glycosyl transferase family 2